MRVKEGELIAGADEGEGGVGNTGLAGASRVNNEIKPLQLNPLTLYCQILISLSSPPVARVCPSQLQAMQVI